MPVFSSTLSTTPFSGGGQVQPNDIEHLGFKFRIRAVMVLFHAVGFDRLVLEDTLDDIFTYAQMFGQITDGPVGSPWRRVAGLGGNAVPDFGPIYRGLARPGKIHKTRHPFFQETLFPLADGYLAGLELPHDLLNRLALGCHQDDLGPHDKLLGAASFSNNFLQPGPLKIS